MALDNNTFPWKQSQEYRREINIFLIFCSLKTVMTLFDFNLKYLILNMKAYYNNGFASHVYNGGVILDG